MNGEVKKEEGQGASPSKPKSLIGKLAEVMGGAGWLKKRGFNASQKYNFATEADALDMVREELAERNIFVLTSVEESVIADSGNVSSSGTKETMAQVKTKHVFMDGDSGEKLEVFSAGCGKDYGDKAIYKAITGSMKYFVTKNFLISTGDDPEEEGAPKSAKAANGSNGSNGKHTYPISSPAIPGEPTKENPQAQVDHGTFEDYIKSGKPLSSGTNRSGPWTLYLIETQGHGDFKTFSKTVYAKAALAVKAGKMVTVVSTPGSRGPEIEALYLEGEALPESNLASTP